MFWTRSIVWHLEIRNRTCRRKANEFQRILIRLIRQNTYSYEYAVLIRRISFVQPYSAQPFLGVIFRIQAISLGMGTTIFSTLIYFRLTNTHLYCPIVMRMDITVGCRMRYCVLRWMSFDIDFTTRLDKDFPAWRGNRMDLSIHHFSAFLFHNPYKGA